MQNDHIIKKLEENSVRGLSEREVALIGSHTASCSDCLRAYEAARVSAVLIQARAGQIEEPSPFFETRVMAALRERQLSNGVPALVSLWKAAGMLVSTMAALIVILIALNFFIDGAGTERDTELTAIQPVYSPEYILLEQEDLTEEGFPYDQVLMTVYESGDGDGE